MSKEEARAKLNGIDPAQLGWRGGSWEDDSLEAKEPVPTHLNTNPSSPFLVISTDKLSAQYSGEGRHGHDVGAVQADCPAPVNCFVYYFEMSVKDKGQRGCVSIGFTDNHFKTSRQPGWEPNSYGYHGDDGLLYHGQGKGERHNFPTFSTGDTVGAGINYASQEIFFTCNGKFLGRVPKDLKGPLYPTIGLHSPNEKVEVNFGQHGPRSFRYNIEHMIREEGEKLQATIENVSLHLSISHRIVRSYLMHYGYQDTLTSFDIASGSTFPPVVYATQESDMNGEIYALEQRKALRKLIRSGDIDCAFSKLRQWYPVLLQDDMSTICFLLHCQRFIEYVKARNLEEAVRYARRELQKFYTVASFQHLLKDAIALLAYEDPENSSLGYLFSLAQREAVADAVNAMVLSTNPALQNPECVLKSSLEKLLKQLTVCCLERRHLNGQEGEIFSLHKLLHGGKVGSR